MLITQLYLASERIFPPVQHLRRLSLFCCLRSTEIILGACEDSEAQEIHATFQVGHIPVIPTLRKLRQGDDVFEVGLNHTVRPGLKRHMHMHTHTQISMPQKQSSGFLFVCLFLYHLSQVLEAWVIFLYPSSLPPFFPSSLPLFNFFFKNF